MIPTWPCFLQHPPSLRRRVKAGVTNTFSGPAVQMMPLDPFVEVSHGKKPGFLHRRWSSVYFRALTDLYLGRVTGTVPGWNLILNVLLAVRRWLEHPQLVFKF